MKPMVSPMTGSDWAHLRELVATIQATVKRRYGVEQLTQTLDDVTVLQRLVDENVFDETQPTEIAAMGAVFGNVLERQLGFEWVMLEDKGQREPGLRLKSQHSFTLMPLRVIKEKLDRGDAVDLSQTFRTVKTDVGRTQIL
jgi:hypothetical protein